MDEARPGPGEELNFEGPTFARPAATVMLVRGGGERLEVLLVQRNPEARFMGGAWVFPGGAVDPGEGEGDRALRTAAIREVAEEAGVELDGPDKLIPFSRWITPAEVKIRFDTWFYVAEMPAGAEPRIDRREVVDARWYEPQAALEAGHARRAAAGLPDHQAPRAAVGLRLGAGTYLPCPGPGGEAGAASGDRLRRGGADRASGRARLRRLTGVAGPGYGAPGYASSAEITCITALISARWVNAWG